MSGPKREKALVRLLSVLVRGKAAGFTYQRNGDSLILTCRAGYTDVSLASHLQCPF